MLEGKALISETDMLQAVQQHALQLAAKALDTFDITKVIEIARYIKIKVHVTVEANSAANVLPLPPTLFQEFDQVHGPGWECIVGADFGSFVTRCTNGCFIYSFIGSFAIMLFKGTALGPHTFPHYGDSGGMSFLFLHHLSCKGECDKARCYDVSDPASSLVSIRLNPATRG